MKIILSRKGFDSGSGGCASPILDGNRLLSLPIPDSSFSSTTYNDVSSTGSAGHIVEDLTCGRIRGEHMAHLDPDIDVDTMPRMEGWRPTFGQTGAAQAHLVSNEVGVGDLFLFFGWFRDVSLLSGKWTFQRGGRSVHAIFGWLQVGDVLSLRNGDATDWIDHPWIEGHPHLNRGPDENNVVYVASRELVLPGLGKTGLSGGGVVRELTERTTLTSPNAKFKSQWLLPSWFYDVDKPSLSYHTSPSRWLSLGEHVLLNSVARGQEFILDCADRPQASRWVLDILHSSDC